MHPATAASSGVRSTTYRGVLNYSGIMILQKKAISNSNSWDYVSDFGPMLTSLSDKIIHGHVPSRCLMGMQTHV
jgi:hypothetical protein